MDGEGAKSSPGGHGRRDAVNPHVRTQNVRDEDGAVRLLIVFHDGNPGPPDGEARAVERVDKFAFSAALRLEADAGAPRLEGFAVRARRNLAELAAGGQPDFEVISFRRGETHVGGAKHHGAVVQAEFFENRLRVAHERFELVVAFLRMRELEELNLLELVLAE